MCFKFKQYYFVFELKLFFKKNHKHFYNPTYFFFGSIELIKSYSYNYFPKSPYPPTIKYPIIINPNSPNPIHNRPLNGPNLRHQPLRHLTSSQLFSAAAAVRSGSQANIRMCSPTTSSGSLDERQLPSRWYTVLALPFPDQRLGRRDISTFGRGVYTSRAGFFSNPLWVEVHHDSGGGGSKDIGDEESESVRRRNRPSNCVGRTKASSQKSGEA